MKLIKMSASWCGPCKQLSKVMQEVDIPYEVQEVDIDQEPALAQQYGIRGVPTLILLDDDGTIRRRTSGSMTKTKLEEWLRG